MERVDEAGVRLGINLTAVEHKLDEVCGVDGQLCEIGRSLDAAHDAIEAMEADRGGGGAVGVAGANVAAVWMRDLRMCRPRPHSRRRRCTRSSSTWRLAGLAIRVDAQGVSDTTAMPAADAALADGSVQAPGGGD